MIDFRPDFDPDRVEHTSIAPALPYPSGEGDWLILVDHQTGESWARVHPDGKWEPLQTEPEQ